MKRLIAIPTCWRYEYFDHGGGDHQNGEHKTRHDAVRRTWLYNGTIGGYGTNDWRFFYGRQMEPQAIPLDAVVLDVPDDYRGLALKVRGMVRWALEQGYDYICKVDDDCYVFLDRLLSRFDPAADYRGSVQTTDETKYASGGLYWLSRRAMAVIADAEPERDEWREDRWVGRTLAGVGIYPTNDPNLRMCDCAECDKRYPIEQVTAIHFYNSRIERMYELHEKCSLTAQT